MNLDCTGKDKEHGKTEHNENWGGDRYQASSAQYVMFVIYLSHGQKTD